MLCFTVLVTVSNQKFWMMQSTRVMHFAKTYVIKAMEGVFERQRNVVIFISAVRN